MNKKLIIVLGVLFASFSALFVRMSSAPSLVLIFYRMLFTVLIMLPVVLLKNREELKNLSKKTFLLCVVSDMFLGLHFVLFFDCLDRTSIASATVLASTDVFLVAFALVFIFKEKVTKQSWMGIVIAFGGSVIIALADIDEGRNMLTGDLMAFAASCVLAVYTIIGRVCRVETSTNTYTFIAYVSTAVTVLIAAAVTSVPVLEVDGRSLLCALGLAVFCTLLGHSIFSWGLKYIQASYIANTRLLSPVFSTVFGMLMFGEIPGILCVVGGVTVIAGVMIYSNNLSIK